MGKNLDNYFGLSDAAHEPKENIVLDHVPWAFEDQLKFGDQPEGKQVIIGIKGSGKTALRRFIEERKGTIVWNIDCDNAYFDIDASAIRGRSGIIKNSLALDLLRGLASHLSEVDSHGITEKVANKARSAFETGMEIIQNVPKALTIDAKFVQIDIAELIKPKASRYVKAAWDEVHSGLMEALEDKEAYIMIDDVEDVFPGLETNPSFIEALVRAIHDINRRSGDRLHILLFMKNGVWRRWFENQTEYDKVGHIIQEISWDHNALCMLIAKRIARIHGKLPKAKAAVESEDLWKLEFAWPKSKTFQSFSRDLTKYCVSGPRDMIVIANKARIEAQEEKITISHINTILKSYSEAKTFELAADFNDVYPEIHRFVECVFQGCPEKMKGSEFAEWIESHSLTDEAVDNQFRSLEWYSLASKERLVSIMYQIGFLGRRINRQTVIYAMQRPTESTAEIISSQLEVHPAFRPFLATTSSNR
jgi:hypothetical protein